MARAVRVSSCLVVPCEHTSIISVRFSLCGIGRCVALLATPTIGRGGNGKFVGLTATLVCEGVIGQPTHGGERAVQGGWLRRR